MIIFSILAIVLIITLVIVVHEFGHFILAKKNGIAVIEFSVGMGPRIFSFVRNGTRYSLKWIPLAVPARCLEMMKEFRMPMRISRRTQNMHFIISPSGRGFPSLRRADFQFCTGICAGSHRCLLCGSQYPLYPGNHRRGSRSAGGSSGGR